MKIKYFIIFGICMWIASCQNQKKHSHKNGKIEGIENQYKLPDSLSSRRISFVLNLKKTVAKKIWNDFGIKKNEGTLIYFNGNQSEIFFPDSHVIKKLNNYKQHNDNYLLTERTDSIPYHMEVMISFNEEDSSEFFYKNAVEQYSSVEEIGKYIPSVESTEMWATMVIHEMFHHFQYNNQKFKEYAESKIGILPFDPRNMIALSQEDNQFLSLIQGENKILMQAISEKNKDKRNSLITSYLDQRKKRITQYSSENPYLEQVENYYTIQEGSARYIEYQSMFILKNYFKNSDAPKILNDPKFISYSEYEEIDFKSNAFNYLVYAGPTTYHYALGFNIMRLLDKLKVEYKKELLNNPEKGLHQYLEDYVNTLSSKN